MGVLERHIQLATDAQEQADLMVEAGEVLRTHLHQTDKAADAFQAALGVFPGHTPALHALGMVYERSGNWPFALEMLHQEAEALGRDPRAVEVLHRMGKINEDMLMDVSSAKACYSEALRIDPEYLPSLQALRGIAENEQDWESYEQILVAEAQATSEATAKARANLAVGRYHSEKREDPDSATALVRGGDQARTRAGRRRAAALRPLHRPGALGARRADARRGHPQPQGPARRREGRRARQGPLPPGVPDGVRAGEAGPA